MKKLIALGMALTLAVGMTACGSSSSAPASSAPASAPASSAPASSAAFATSLADIKAKGTLVIGLDDTFAPMGFRDADDKLVGFDIDLATAVCEEMGVTATFQPIDWDAKELELSTGKIDCIWNGMSITPERMEKMSLTNPYLNNKIIIMTNKGVEIKSKEDLANFNLGTQIDSSALEVIKADAVYDSIKDNLTEYPTYDEAILDMKANRVDAIIVDEVLGQYKNNQMDGAFDVSTVDFGEDLYAIGFRKGDTELTEAVNSAIKALIENGSAGTICEKWFGQDIMVK